MDLGGTSRFLGICPRSNAAGRPFAETTDVVLVQIPVYVTRNGTPVHGLTAENFEVLEGRKKQRIVAVDVFDLELLPESTSAPADIPAAGRRNFLLLFDLSNSLPAGIVRARKAALELARTGLHPSDLVSVATYSKTRGIEIVMAFSTDRAQLVAAVEGLGLVQPFAQFSDPLRLNLAEVSYLEGGGGQTFLFDKLEDDPGGGGRSSVINNALIENLRTSRPSPVATAGTCRRHRFSTSPPTSRSWPG